MVAGTAFLVIGIFLAFIGAIIDGVTASAVSVRIDQERHTILLVYIWFAVTPCVYLLAR